MTLPTINPDSLHYSDSLKLEWVLVTDALSFQADCNPKKHDIGQLAQAIRTHGFQDPPKWDASLNDGNGGVVYGNGRIEALAWLQNYHNSDPDSYPVPRGIAVCEDGQWAMPITVGVEFSNELEAKKFLVDHNNLTLSGGDFTALDMARMWEAGKYNQLLQSISDGTDKTEDDLTLTIDRDDFELLGKAYRGELDDDNEKFEPESSAKEIDVDSYEFNKKCPKCGFEFNG